MTDAREEIAAYWATEICDIAPGRIALRGYPIEQLIGKLTFPEIIWLMLRGELPSAGQTRLLDAALVAAVDHGPHAPSIAIARMAVTTGLSLNGALASAVNTLDTVHGGAGEQALELFSEFLEGCGSINQECILQGVRDRLRVKGAFIPGFGHRFHPRDPRVPPLLRLVEQGRNEGVVTGRFAQVGTAVEQALEQVKGVHIPMNIDGITAIIFGELGFPAPLARGLFCLSRSVGIIAHAWEQSQRHERNRGPIPRSFAYRYEGQGRRDLPKESIE